MLCLSTAQSAANCAGETCIQQPAENTSSSIPPSIPTLHFEASTSFRSLKPCSVCQSLTNFKCAECKDIYYCSKECRKEDYFNHRRICCRVFKAYIFYPLSRVYRFAVFNVIDFLKAPDQPMDPPDTEAFEDIQHLWRFL